MEEWKHVSGYVNYEVSNKGRIRNKHSGRVLKPQIVRGYHYVSLSNSGKRKTHQLHRLIAKEFLTTFSEELVVNHKDGNKLNNVLDNLEMVSQADNLYHAGQIGLNPNLKLSREDVVLIRELLDKGYTQAYIAEIYNISQSFVSQINTGSRW